MHTPSPYAETIANTRCYSRRTAGNPTRGGHVPTLAEAMRSRLTAAREDHIGALEDYHFSYANRETLLARVERTRAVLALLERLHNVNK